MTWIVILIIAVIIGGIWGWINGDSGEDALSGAMAGGCLAGNCLFRLLLAGLSILFILWLFNLVFG